MPFRRSWAGPRKTRSFAGRSLAPVVILAWLCTTLPHLRAQNPTDQKSATTPKADSVAPQTAAPAGTESKPMVTEGDRLSFDQSKVAAEMNELEERMFRLAEAIKELEPENSSRLRLALKNAREELILHQMKETQELLRKLELNDALTEEKQLLAKLQRLHDLLLSMDLDFQMRLERLRLIREILRRLDAAIKEEDREQKLSRDVAQLEKDAPALRQRRATVEELIERQTTHIEQDKKLAKLERVEAEARKAFVELTEDQEATRTKTKSLAEATARSGSESKNLGVAELQMGQATESLQQEQASEALPHQEQALDSLKKELGRVVEELKRREQQAAPEKFSEMRQDQSGNRQATDGIAQSTRQLGDSGATALAELIRAGGNMSSAEDQLDRRQPHPASMDQERALQSLKYARDELAREEQQLLEGLRGEVKRRVLEALTIMLEKQIAVRESTESLGVKVNAGSREALASVVGLSKVEGRIIEVLNEVLTLVEETEFGIALPAALRVVGRSMVSVKGSLAKGDATPPVIAQEREIESDLKSLLEAMKQLPASASSSDPRQRGQRDRERELNRLVAELKMLRILQVRVNAETIDVDAKRPADDPATLSAAIRKAIAGVEDHQDEVREATQRLADERGQEVQ